MLIIKLIYSCCSELTSNTTDYSCRNRCPSCDSSFSGLHCAELLYQRMWLSRAQSSSQASCLAFLCTIYSLSAHLEQQNSHSISPLCVNHSPSRDDNSASPTATVECFPLWLSSNPGLCKAPQPLGAGVALQIASTLKDEFDCEDHSGATR